MVSKTKIIPVRIYTGVVVQSVIISGSPGIDDRFFNRMPDFCLINFKEGL
jgi:hypothetical protein